MWSLTGPHTCEHHTVVCGQNFIFEQQHVIYLFCTGVPLSARTLLIPHTHTHTQFIPPSVNGSLIIKANNKRPQWLKSKCKCVFSTELFCFVFFVFVFFCVFCEWFCIQTITQKYYTKTLRLLFFAVVSDSAKIILSTLCSNPPACIIWFLVLFATKKKLKKTAGLFLLRLSFTYQSINHSIN